MVVKGVPCNPGIASGITRLKKSSSCPTAAVCGPLLLVLPCFSDAEKMCEIGVAA